MTIQLNKNYWVWSDTDKKRPVVGKIIEGAEMYKFKYGKYPTSVYVNTSLDLEFLKQSLTLRVDSSSNIPDGCFWYINE